MTIRSVRFSAVVLGVAFALGRPPASVEAAPPSCSINSVTPLSFGAYDPFSATADDAAGNVKYSCTGGPTLQISLSGMLSGPTRQMSSSGDTLEYNVYTTAARTVLFGDGSFGASALVIGQVKTTGQQTTNFYGRAPAGQDVIAGNYSATLVITLNF